MKYFFVVGCPRSGTTWLRMLLAQHPAVATTRETNLFNAYIAALQMTWDKNPITPSRATGLQTALTEDQFTTLCANFARGVLQHIEEATPDAKVLVEKTPAHVHHVPLILKLLPEAHFIHLIRDPRAAVASLCAASRSWGRLWISPDPIDNVNMWVRDVSAGCQIASLTDRSTTVKYEALLEPTGWRVLQDLLHGMELDADNDFCRQAMAECAIDRLRKKAEDNLKSRGVTQPRSADFFRKGKANSWMGELTKRDVEAIEYIAGDLMHECGYTASTRFANRHSKPRLLKRRELLSSLEWRAKRIVARIFDKLRHRT